jgi:hypothetical protein
VRSVATLVALATAVVAATTIASTATTPASTTTTPGGAATTLTSAAAKLTSAARAPARHASPSYYLSLGDSLSRGVQPDPAGASLPTQQGYPDQLYAALHLGHPGLRLVKLGCSGETTHTMIEASGPGNARPLRGARTSTRGPSATASSHWPSCSPTSAEPAWAGCWLATRSPRRRQ